MMSEEEPSSATPSFCCIASRKNARKTGPRAQNAPNNRASVELTTPGGIDIIDLTKDSPESTRTRKRRRANTFEAAASDESSSSRQENERQRSVSVASSDSVLIESVVGDIVVLGAVKKPRIKHRVPSSPKNSAEPPAALPPPPPPPPVAYKCPICLDDNIELKAKMVQLMVIPCGHMMCKPCSQVLNTTECPVCRKKFRKNTIKPLFL